MISSRLQSDLMEIAQEIDMLVYRLELPRDGDVAENIERDSIRTELEKIRDVIDTLSRDVST